MGSSGSGGESTRLRDAFGSYAGFVSYMEKFREYKPLGYATAADLWDENPLVEWSSALSRHRLVIDGDDYAVACRCSSPISQEEYSQDAAAWLQARYYHQPSDTVSHSPAHYAGPWWRDNAKAFGWNVTAVRRRKSPFGLVWYELPTDQEGYTVAVGSEPDGTAYYAIKGDDYFTDDVFHGPAAMRILYQARRLYEAAYVARFTLRSAFHAVFEQYSERDGQAFTLVRAILEPDEDHEAIEFEPTYVVRFADGTEIEAWHVEVFKPDAGEEEIPSHSDWSESSLEG